MAEFGELLAELRKDRKLTQRELAARLFVTPGTISNYEKGVHLPDIEKLILLADFFHVTTDYLLGRCSDNLSPDVFREPVSRDMTVGQAIQELRALPPEKREAVAIILRDMKISGILSQIKKD